MVEFVKAIEAPAKGMTWFEQSGHSPPWEEPDAFRARLLEVYRGVAREEAHHGSPDIEFLDREVAGLMEEWRVPGLSVAVLVDGQTRVLRRYGLRELGKPDPVDEHTVFALASTTKAFTAAVIGILVDEGLLDWDDLVATRLPGYRFRDPRIAGSLSIRDLLTHRSGYDRHDALWHAFGHSRKEILERLGRLGPSWRALGVSWPREGEPARDVTQRQIGSSRDSIIWSSSGLEIPDVPMPGSESV